MTTTLYNAKHWKVPVPPLPDDIDVKAQEFVNKNSTETSVLIVGAGVAGLFAAYTLEYLGVTNYEILEASSRIGGRFHATDKLIGKGQEDRDGFELDLGAEWCHVNPQVLEDLLLFKDDKQKVADKTSEALFQFNPKTWMFQNKAGRPVRRDFMRFLYQEYKFKSTTWGDYLQDYVLPRIDIKKIKLNTPVVAIDYSNTKGSDGLVKITTTDGASLHAHKVVVAVSLGVTQKDLIAYTPPLPPMQREAIEKAPMADGLKIMIQFKERFYTDITLPNPLWELTDHDLVGFYDAVSHKDTTKHILGVAVVGTEGRSVQLAAMDNERDIVQEILRLLDNLYDGQASKQYMGHDMINWSKMPYIQGAYSHITDPDLSKTIGLPLTDKVFFAGEHVSEVHIGYMHGSAITGRRAAVMAVGGKARKIQPCRLSPQDCI